MCVCVWLGSLVCGVSETCLTSSPATCTCMHAVDIVFPWADNINVVAKRSASYIILPEHGLSRACMEGGRDDAI